MVKLGPLAPMGAAPIRALGPMAKPTPTSRPLTAAVSKILPFSCVDGPGSRLVVFFQGCNMRCGSCHNPHTIGLCNHCGECVPHCPESALTLERGSGQRKRLLLDDARCQGCDSCQPHCPRSGNPAARRFDIESLVAEIRKHALLLDGITVSGGEATLQHRFLLALFDALEADPECAHLGRLIDSNGLLAADKWPALLDRCDGVMLDLKAQDDALHRRLTGRSNAQVLASAKLLAEAGKLAEVRWLVMEGLNDSEAEIQALVALLHSLPGAVPLRLNRYRHHGVAAGFAARHPETSAGRMNALRQQLGDLNVQLR